MYWYHNLDLRLKISIPLLILAFLILIIGTRGIQTAGDLQQHSRIITREYIPAIDYVFQADRDLYQAQVAERSLLLTPVNSNEYHSTLASYKENIAQVKERIGSFVRISSNERLKQQAKTLLTLYEQWLKTSHEVIALSSDDTPLHIKEATDISLGRGQIEFDTMRGVLDVLGEQIIKETDLLIGASEATYKQGRKQLWVLVSIALALCTLTILIFPKTLTQRIKNLLDLSLIVEKEGRLDVSSKDKHTDEIGQLAQGFNALIYRTHSALSKIQQASHNINHSSKDLARISTEANQEVNRQHQSIDMMATATNQMSVSLQQVATHAAQASSAAHISVEQARTGRDVVSSASQKIMDLSNNVKLASNVVMQLEKVAGNIASVLDVIRNIAEQTNLLALNAAIEAARAGDAGRGFAVVADEVRSLASKTQESTTHIQDMIEQLQQGVSQTVKVMEESTTQAGITRDFAVKADETLAMITESMGNINDMLTQIAISTDQQNQAVEEVNKSIHEVHGLSDNTSERTTKTMNASQALQNLSEQLDAAVKQFRLA